jgi:hypothetical protein
MPHRGEPREKRGIFMDSLRNIILERYDAADKYLATKRAKWDSYENLFHNILDDKISVDNARSQVFDPKLSSLILEREARVMAQLPTGKVRAVSKNDEGASKLMNLTLDKYVVPNANAQFDFLTKCRMVDRYSNIYGNFFVMVDWDVRKNGYRGPDMWLLPIRDVFPQVGAISLDDSDYVIVRSWRKLSFFEDLQGKKREGFKNLSEIVAKLKDQAGSKQARTSSDTTKREENAYPQANPAKKDGFYEVLSMFERDRWVDYCVDADMVFRDSDNPHENDELPIVNKFSVPLLDDFMAMGDSERGAPMQNTLNSIWNLYMDAVKMSIFPPTLINKDNVSDPNSIKFSYAAKWMMRNAPGSAGTTGAQVLNLTPQGTSTFNNVYQVITSGLLNMFGTTNTSTTQETDPGFGKTPQALQMQAARENAKDNVDRFYMEQFLTKVNKKFVNLISKKRMGPIQFRMFEEEIDELAKSYEDVREMYDPSSGKLTIKKDSMGSILYDYEIVSGSTYAVDQKQQQSNLMGILNLMLNPQSFQLISQSLQSEGKELRVGELFSRIISNSGITDWDKIVVDKSNDPGAVLGDIQAQFDMALQQVGGVNGVPPQPMGPNEVSTQA